jgi:hypothetical protein
MVREVKNTDLLSIARTVLRDEVLNVVPEHKKYEALMVANAMAIAAREAVYGSLAEPSKAFLTSLLLVSGETDEPIENIIKKLRLGAFDPDNSKTKTLHQALLVEAERKVKVSNLQYLK